MSEKTSKLGDKIVILSVTSKCVNCDKSVTFEHKISDSIANEQTISKILSSQLAFEDERLFMHNCSEDVYSRLLFLKAEFIRDPEKIKLLMEKENEKAAVNQ